MENVNIPMSEHLLVQYKCNTIVEKGQEVRSGLRQVAAGMLIGRFSA